MIKKNLSIIVTLIALLIFVACGNHVDESVKSLDEIRTLSNNKYQVISAKTAKHFIDLAILEKGFEDGSFVVVDVRTTAEFMDEHIPNAINIPNETIESLKPRGLTNVNAIVLVYCRSGNRSKDAAKKLINLGYHYVFDFGGINSWPYEKVK